MKIDYTNFLKANRSLSNMGQEEKQTVFNQIREAMKSASVKGKVEILYYEDGAQVNLNGAFYGVWSYKSVAFFAGYVGDYRPLECRI